MLNFHRSSNKVLALLLSVSVVTPVFAHFSSTEKAELLEYAKMSTSIVLDNDTLSIHRRPSAIEIAMLGTLSVGSGGVAIAAAITGKNMAVKVGAAALSGCLSAITGYMTYECIQQRQNNRPFIIQFTPSGFKYNTFASPTYNISWSEVSSATYCPQTTAVPQGNNGTYINQNTSSIIVYGNNKKILAQITPHYLFPCSMETIYNILCAYLSTAQTETKN